MAPDPRLSDRELLAINAAAAYSVKPHLGRHQVLYPVTLRVEYNSLPDYRTVSAINGRVLYKCASRI